MKLKETFFDEKYNLKDNGIFVITNNKMLRSFCYYFAKNMKRQNILALRVSVWDQKIQRKNVWIEKINLFWNVFVSKSFSLTYLWKNFIFCS